MAKKMLTVQQAAERLEISDRGVVHLIKSGETPGRERTRWPALADRCKGIDRLHPGTFQGGQGAREKAHGRRKGQGHEECTGQKITVKAGRKTGQKERT